MKANKLTCIAVSLLAASSFSSAQAAVVITAVEDSGNVVFSIEDGGALDISGLLFGLSIDYFDNGAINPANNAILFGATPLSGAVGEYTVWQGVSGPAFGPGLPRNADLNTNGGEPFGFGGDELWIDSTYVSGDIITSATMTFASETFDSLGIVPDTYVYTLMGSNDTITLNVVPIPAAIWMFGSALGLLIASRKTG